MCLLFNANRYIKAVSTCMALAGHSPGGITYQLTNGIITAAQHCNVILSQ